MRIAMIGSGYVGLVSGACFSQFGIEVVCVDKNRDKIDGLNRGELPIFEPGLDTLMASNVAAGRLVFSTDLRSAVDKADAVFIAVGTPSRRGDGHADLLVGAHAAPGNTAVGRVYLVLGPVGGTVPLAQADAVFLGEAPLDWAGHSLDGAGDVNGDGLDDLFIAAPYNDEADSQAGAQYLVYGTPSGTIDLANADAKFLGEMIDDEAGMSVAGAGDVDGDGYDDLLVGSGYQDAGMTMSGAVYLILGGP